MNNIQQQSLTLQANSQLKEQQHLHSNNYQQPINSNNFLKESNTIEIEKKSLSQSFNVSSSTTPSVNTISNTNNNEHSVEQPKLILNNVGNIKNNCNNENNTNYSSSSSVATNSGGNFYMLTSANQDPSSSNHLNSALTFSNQNSATIQMAVKQPIQKQLQFINTNDIQHLQTQQPSSPQFKFVTTNTTVNNNLASVSSNFNQTSMNSSPRVIIQQQQSQPVQQQTAFIVQQQQQQQIHSSNNNNNQVSQMYLNINNRIVPIQALNLKQTNSSNQNTTIGLPTTIVATQSNNNLTINGTNQTTFDIQQQQHQQSNASNQFQRLQILSTTPGSSASINFSNSNQLNIQQQQTQQLNQLKSSSVMNTSSQSYSSSVLQMPLNNNSNNNISSGNINNNNINNVNTSNNNQPQYYIVSNNTSLQSISTPNGTLINNSNGVNLQPNSPLLIQSTNNINGGGNTITMLANNTNLNTEISEKMRELEGIQSQLRTFQFKLQSSDAMNNSKSPVTAVTQQQIQSVLSPVEQSQLQKLLLQRKTVQTEIQRLQQKILTPSTAENTIQVQSNDSVINNNNNTSALTITSTSTTTPNTIINNNANNTPLTKLQLYQQILIKLNNFKNSKLVINNQQQKDISQSKTQELRMTPEEFENYKKLLTMQAQLEKELNLTKEQIQSIQQKLFQADFTISSNLNQNQNETPINQAFDQNNGKTSSQTFSSIKLSECSLSDKHKILDVIKKQINMLKNTLNSFNSIQPSAINQQQQQQQEQIKEKYIILLKKQTELQNLIDVEERDHSNTKNNGNNKNEIVSTTDIGLIQPQQYKVLNHAGQIINVANLNFDATSNQPKQNNLVLTTGSSSIPSPNIQIVNNHSNISTMSSPNANQQTKQAPIKIRNVIASVSSTPSSNTTTPTVTNPTSTLLTKTTNFNTPIRSNQTPLRALVLNNNSPHVISTTNSPVIVSTSNSSSSINSNNNNNDNNNNCNILPLSSIINLQKLHFPNVQFKCLNFDELAQHGIITKQTDETTIEMLKELDLKATQLISQDQVETFAKNQVKLARKYLEQQMSLKNSKRRKFQDQLAKDHKNVLERQNFTTLFEDRTDAIKRLAPYHIFQKTLYEPNEEENSKFDECFEEVSEKLLKTADAMKKRFHLLQLRSMQKQVSSSEETLMLKLFVDDLKQNIESEKKFQSNQPLSIKVSTQANEANSTIRQILNISNSNDTSSVAAINTNNINNDFNLISNQNTNPLKRHIKTEENESNKQQVIYRISDQPIIKSESIKNLFQNMKTESSLVQSNSALNKTVSKSNTTSSSFFASSSSSSSISIPNKNLNILEDQSESSDYEYLDENNKNISKSFQMSSLINSDFKKENNTSIQTNFLNLNNTSKEINNHLDFKNNHDTVNYQATNSFNYNHINNTMNNNNNNCNEDVTGLDDFILNEDDDQVNQNEIDY